MNRALGLVLLSLTPLFSCSASSPSDTAAIESAVPTNESATPNAASTAPSHVTAGSAPSSVSAPTVPAATNDEPTGAPLPDTRTASLPSGTFVTVGALCARQMRDVVPQLARTQGERRESYGDDSEPPAVPSCKEDHSAMAGVRVSLEAPYTSVTAVTYEVGFATQTNLVVKTREGWRNASTPIVSVEHDDPGCPSILRDAGLTEVRVESGRLVVVDKADRAWGDEISLVYDRVRSCSVAGACTPPVTVGAREVPWHQPENEKRLFETTYTIDPGGMVHAALPFADDRFGAFAE